MGSSTVHKDEKLHGLGPSVVKDGLQRGTDGAAGEEHVVHQHHVLVVKGRGNMRFTDGGPGVQGGPVVAVEVDVQRAERKLAAKLFFQHLAEAQGQIDAAPLDAQQHGLFAIAVAFHDLAGQPVEDAGHFVGVKENGGLHGQLPGRPAPSRRGGAGKDARRRGRRFRKVRPEYTILYGLKRSRRGSWCAAGRKECLTRPARPLCYPLRPQQRRLIRMSRAAGRPLPEALVGGKACMNLMKASR